MIKQIVKKILPQFVQAKFKDIKRLSFVFYLLRTVQTYQEWLFKSYHLKYQADKAIVLKNYIQYESLFEPSVKNFETIVTPWIAEFRWPLGRIYNGSFVSIDPELYYSIIRQYKPSLIVEIGSGHSTHFAADALKKNKTGRIISIDPEPRRSLPINVQHRQEKVEDVSTEIFLELKENDILFIDSSHTTEEARFHCREILPRLHEGVIIHHHDFTFPYDICYEDDPAVFGESQVLLDFYSVNRSDYEVLVCASYVRFLDPLLVRRLIKSYKWNPQRIPGSLWIKKK
ncbi:MAG: class I SAM-dependent methyltransferase [Candidatus Aureabacteria bacterium]|nr:class I SAM-dependent methyltransferase [Candidatus Auribacterota bacterium]